MYVSLVCYSYIYNYVAVLHSMIYSVLHCLYSGLQKLILFYTQIAYFEILYIMSHMIILSPTHSNIHIPLLNCWLFRIPRILSLSLSYLFSALTVWVHQAHHCYIIFIDVLYCNDNTTPLLFYYYLYRESWCFIVPQCSKMVVNLWAIFSFSNEYNFIVEIEIHALVNRPAGNRQYCSTIALRKSNTWHIISLQLVINWFHSCSFIIFNLSWV